MLELKNGQSVYCFASERGGGGASSSALLMKLHNFFQREYSLHNMQFVHTFFVNIEIKTINSLKKSCQFQFFDRKICLMFDTI